MGENIILKNTFKSNLWILRNIICSNILAFVIWFFFLKIYGIIGLLIILGFLDIVLLGLLGVFIHRQYYSFEKKRLINISGNTVRFFCNDKLIKEVEDNDINRIILVDKIMNGGNSFPTFVDSYFFFTIILKDGTHMIITCLTHPSLKNIIKEWSKIEIEHKTVFFPFLRLKSLPSLLK